LFPFCLIFGHAHFYRFLIWFPFCLIFGHAHFHRFLIWFQFFLIFGHAHFYGAHHVLADGFSLLKLFILDICQEKRLILTQPENSAANSTGSKIQRFLGPFYMLIRSPIDIATALLDVLAYNHNEWHVPEKTLTRRLNSARSNTISVQKVKEVKNRCNCSFASVLLATYTGALRYFQSF